MYRKIKVLLINNPTTNQIREGVAGFPLEYIKKHHPIGLMYVGTFVKYHSEADVKIMDFGPEIIEEKYKSQVKEVLRDFKPDIVGINSFSWTLYDGYEIAKTVKSENNRIPIVFGGIHTSLYPEEMIKQDFIDFLVLGEGEETFLEFLSKFGTQDMYYVNGLISKKKNGIPEIIVNPKRQEIITLDKIPFPDRNLLLNKDIYKNLLLPNMCETVMLTSRGCPYSCAYCQVEGKKYRARSPRNVVDEMEYVSDLGYNFVDFFDDSMNMKKERIKEMCREIVKRGLHKKLKWKFRGVANLIDEEMVSLMKEAGCEIIYIGIESGNDMILKSVNRVINTKDCRKAVELAKKYRMKVLGYFIIGFPDETEDNIEETINFALTLPLDYIQVRICTPTPGTRLYLQAVNDTNFGGDWFKEYTKKPWKNCSFRFYETKVNINRLRKLQKLFYRKFYIRPRFFLQNILNGGLNLLAIRRGLKFFWWCLN